MIDALVICGGMVEYKRVPDVDPLPIELRARRVSFFPEGPPSLRTPPSPRVYLRREPYMYRAESGAHRRLTVFCDDSLTMEQRLELATGAMFVDLPGVQPGQDTTSFAMGALARVAGGAEMPTSYADLNIRAYRMAAEVLWNGGFARPYASPCELTARGLIAAKVIAAKPVGEWVEAVQAALQTDKDKRAEADAYERGKQDHPRLQAPPLDRRLEHAYLRGWYAMYDAAQKAECSE